MGNRIDKKVLRREFDLELKWARDACQYQDNLVNIEFHLNEACKWLAQLQAWEGESKVRND